MVTISNHDGQDEEDNVREAFCGWRTGAHGRARRVWDGACLQDAEREADPEPWAVFCISGDRGRLLHGDRDPVSLFHHCISGTYANACAKQVLLKMG